MGMTDSIMQAIEGNVNPYILIICALAGVLLKHTWKNFDNNYIPAVAVGLGIVMSFCMYNEISFTTFFCGAISGAASTGFHQVIKNLLKAKTPTIATDEDGEKITNNRQG